MLSFRGYFSRLQEANRALEDDHIDIFHGTHGDPESFRSGGIDPSKGSPLLQGKGFYAWGGRQKSRIFTREAEKGLKGEGESGIDLGGKKATAKSKNLTVGTRVHVDHLIPDAELLHRNPTHHKVVMDWAEEHQDDIKKALEAHHGKMDLPPSSGRGKVYGSKKEGSFRINFTTQGDSISGSDATTSHTAKFAKEYEEDEQGNYAGPREGSGGTSARSHLFDILHQHARPVLSKLVKALHKADRKNLAVRYVGPKITDPKNIRIQS